MRTTLTLDDDVAKAVERLRKARGYTYKRLINQALREGLKQIAAPAKKRKAFQTSTVDLGACLIGNVDNVADVLAIAESESFK
jgi:predicted transcriptional regulator